MYTFEISCNPLTPEERLLYHPHLLALGIEESIWDVYDKFLEIQTKYSKPKIIRIYRNNEELACFFVIRCTDYGGTLSRLGIVKLFTRILSIPVFVWMRAGIAAEIFANPAFFNLKIQREEDLAEILRILKKKFLLLIIHDLICHAPLHPGSFKMPYVDEGIIDTGSYKTLQDYLEQHRNLKKKLKEYQKTGGIVDVLTGSLDNTIVDKIRDCVVSTGAKSVFQLPYQESYQAMCAGSAKIPNTQIVHFLCRSENTFYGYHSFIMFSKQIRCLNGAFNRNLATTHHAYENMIVRVVGFALEHGIQTVYFGPVLNETKRRMMARFIPTQVYLSSKLPWLLRLFIPILNKSRMQSKDVLEFSGINKIDKIDEP
jgi:hypothetical protein